MDALAQEPSHSNRLPSMADLLLQGTANFSFLSLLSVALCSGVELLTTGSSRLMEDIEGNLDITPIFRTGSGKSVAVKQSSISKALAIFGDEADQVNPTGASKRYCFALYFILTY